MQGPLPHFQQPYHSRRPPDGLAGTKLSWQRVARLGFGAGGFTGGGFGMIGSLTCVSSAGISVACRSRFSYALCSTCSLRLIGPLP